MVVASAVVVVAVVVVVVVGLTATWLRRGVVDCWLVAPWCGSGAGLAEARGLVYIGFAVLWYG